MYIYIGNYQEVTALCVCDLTGRKVGCFFQPGHIVSIDGAEQSGWD